MKKFYTASAILRHASSVYEIPDAIRNKEMMDELLKTCQERAGDKEITIESFTVTTLQEFVQQPPATSYEVFGIALAAFMIVSAEEP